MADIRTRIDELKKKFAREAATRLPTGYAKLFELNAFMIRACVITVYVIEGVMEL